MYHIVFERISCVETEIDPMLVSIGPGPSPRGVQRSCSSRGVARLRVNPRSDHGSFHGSNTERMHTLVSPHRANISRPQVQKRTSKNAFRMPVAARATRTGMARHGTSPDIPRAAGGTWTWIGHCNQRTFSISRIDILCCRFCQDIHAH